MKKETLRFISSAKKSINQKFILTLMLFLYAGFIGSIYAQSSVVVTNAEDVNVNGTYTEAGTSNSRPYFAFGNYRLEYRDSGFGLEWEVWNTTEPDPGLQVLYYNAAADMTPPANGWLDNTDIASNLTAAYNIWPVLASIEGTTLSYSENDVATVVTGSITVSDDDNTNIESATIQITGNYQNGQDVLSFVDQNGITGTWTAATGTMSLSGSATKANYETALRSVKYINTSDNPSTAPPERYHLLLTTAMQTVILKHAILV